MIFFILLWTIIPLFLLGLYIVTAISLYTIAQRRGIQHPYLAWIPVAQDYLFAEIIGSELKVNDKTILYFPWVYVGCIYGIGIILTILGFIPILGAIIAFAGGLCLLVAGIYVSYRFFRLFDGGNEALFTVFSTIFPVTRPFFLLYLRNQPFIPDPNYTNYAV